MHDHAEFLSTLASATASDLKRQAETILPALGSIEVLENRSGLVMLPMHDTVKETDFHIGEVLVSEAHIRLKDYSKEGYGMVIGRDLERAMAMAVLDGAYSAGVEIERVSKFVETSAQAQASADEETLRRIEATRVAMETF